MTQSIVRILVIIMVVLLAATFISGLLMLIPLRRRQRQEQQRRDEQLQKTRDGHIDGLRNFEQFTQEVLLWLSCAQPGAYTMTIFDVDHLEEMREQCGEDEAKQMLYFIGQYLCSSSVPPALVARLDDQRFVLLCVSESHQDLLTALDARWILTDFPDLSTLLGDDFALTLSVGSYVIKDPGLPLDTMIERADLARQRGKDVEGSTAFFYSDVEALEQDSDQLLELQLRGKMTMHMERALTSAEFVPYMQPQFSLSTSKLVGAEVLCRWQSEEMGTVFPADFIPFFEQNGFICRLDYYMFERCCALLNGWKESQFSQLPRLSVNISKQTACQPDFVDRLLAITEQYGVDHALLEVDITTSPVEYDPQVLTCATERLRELDFGVLADGSVVTHIETQAQADSIKLDPRHADIVQGYFFSRPMPWYEFEYSVLANV